MSVGTMAAPLSVESLRHGAGPASDEEAEPWARVDDLPEAVALSNMRPEAKPSTRASDSRGSSGKSPPRYQRLVRANVSRLYRKVEPSMLGQKHPATP